MINRGPHRPGAYITHWRRFRFLPGALAGLKLLSQRGCHLVVVSNQSGIAKEVYSQAALRELTHRMIRGVEAAGAHLDLVTYCPHRDQDHCRCRKPKPGLVRHALQALKLRRPRMFVIGDARRDMEMGERVGATTVLVLSGQARRERVRFWTVRPDHISRNLLTAARWILRHGRATR